MSLLDLINAIEAGDSQNIEKHFDYEMTSRIAECLDDKRMEVAKNMFNEDVEVIDEKLDDNDWVHIKRKGSFHDPKNDEIVAYSKSHKNSNSGPSPKKGANSAIRVSVAKKHGYTLKEDIEIIDEISKDTLKSYVDKSSKEGVKAHGEGDLDKAKKRYKGVHAALNKLTKEDFEDITPEDIEEFMQTEEFDQLDEISKDTLRSYMDKSIQSYSDTGTKLRSKLQQGEEDPKLRKKIMNRLQGQMKAYDKLKKA